MDKARTLAWRHGVVSVNALGGMIGPTSFVLGDGRQVSPFHIAPWFDEPEVTAQGGLTAGLRGEWPCVPFGYPFPSDDYPADWPGEIEARAEVEHPHGYASNVDWTFEAAAEDHIALRVDYPEDHAVKCLRRVVRPDPDAAALDFELTVTMRRASCEPLALHGCFALPRAVGRAVIEPGRFMRGWTHPATVEPEAPIFASAKAFDSLNAVPGRSGGMIDAALLPFDAPGEDLLELDGMAGPIALANHDAGYRMTFDWDRDVLPSLLIWYSNRGRSAAPWKSRHLCVGLEPLCSPFGMSPDMARAENPINATGTPTCVPLTLDTPLTIRYRISVAELERS
ncbi:hypothetical protein [Oceaniglobus trochenteri]|uniref:hypothetical protein n=1 Tax=Oceaniglobus trochenteri TaxID=2763260 RepID=UPI001CFFDB8C|nr:hypothetical protein [Oceaniglobus trochenteri]